MQELHDRLDKLLFEAARCEIIGSMATDNPDNREDFWAVARGYRMFADQVREQIVLRRKRGW